MQVLPLVHFVSKTMTNYILHISVSSNFISFCSFLSALAHRILFSVYRAVTLSFVKTLRCLVFIQNFLKRNMNRVALIDRNGNYLLPIISQYSHFVQYNVGSLSISENLLFPIFPPLFTSLSKNCVVSISSKDSLLSFFSVAAEILSDYVSITKCHRDTCDDSRDAKK